MPHGSSSDFEAARQKNLGYNITYGAHANVSAPHWSGTEGDLVAQTRMNWPSAGAKRYFSSDQYNQFAKSFVQTALQGEGRDIGDYHRLAGRDDYTPQIGRTKIMDHTQYPAMQKVGASEQQNEMLIVGIVVVGLLGLMFFISRD